jgi:hypothetical protein
MSGQLSGGRSRVGKRDALAASPCFSMLLDVRRPDDGQESILQAGLVWHFAHSTQRRQSLWLAIPAICPPGEGVIFRLTGIRTCAFWVMRLSFSRSTPAHSVLTAGSTITAARRIVADNNFLLYPRGGRWITPAVQRRVPGPKDKRWE